MTKQEVKIQEGKKDRKKKKTPLRGESETRVGRIRRWSKASEQRIRLRPDRRKPELERKRR